MIGNAMTDRVRDENTDSPQPSNRWVRLRCPMCGHRSPATDQRTDIRRDLLRRWWQKHLDANHRHPSPIFETATEADMEEADAV